MFATYLGIFQAEMTHVVVDQAETKTSVHDSQAPLKWERGDSTSGVYVNSVAQEKAKQLWPDELLELKVLSWIRFCHAEKNIIEILSQSVSLCFSINMKNYELFIS